MFTPTLFSGLHIEDEGFGFDKENDYCGILTIWNVDTFPGGKMSKSDYLDNVAKGFSARMGGVYFKIQNKSVEEFRLSLESGELPDLISFGQGIENQVADIVDNVSCGSVNFVESLKGFSSGNDQVKFLPYMLGCYALFSTSEKVGNLSEEEMIQNALSFGKDVTINKKQKHIYSLVCSDNGFACGLNAIPNTQGGDVLVEKSEYDAYLSFYAYNNASILLGTQRDLSRLEGKLQVGKISDLIVHPLDGTSDLVQYIGVCKNQSEERAKISQGFVNYLLCEEAQNQIKGVGMFSVLQELNLYEDVLWSRFEQATKKCCYGQ